MLINGILDDIPIHNLNNHYTQYRLKELNENKNGLDKDYSIIYENILNNLSLKDILVYGKDDIQKKILFVIKDINFIKQNHIDIVVKKFLDLDICSQRSMLINLLLYKEDSDIQYTCYILYDLINSNATCLENQSDDSILYDSLPWNIKQNFKNIIKSNIKQNQN